MPSEKTEKRATKTFSHANADLSEYSSTISRSSKVPESVGSPSIEYDTTRTSQTQGQESAEGSDNKKMSQARATADFGDLYMRQIAIEFATDLERLRTADDFQHADVPCLMRALRDGTATFEGMELSRLTLSRMTSRD
jgi:ribosome assembly protein 3